MLKTATVLPDIPLEQRITAKQGIKKILIKKKKQLEGKENH